MMMEPISQGTGTAVPTVPNVTAKVYPVKDAGKLLAFASVNLGGIFAVSNIRIYHSEEGPFISMPSSKGRDGRYHDICCPTTKEMREALHNAVLVAYEKAVEQERSPSMLGTLKDAMKEAAARRAAAPAQEQKADKGAR